MNYKIYPLYQGTRQMAIHDLLYRNHGSEILPMTYGAFLLKGEDGSMLMIDSGGPSVSEAKEKGYPLRMPDEDIEMVDQVRKAGADPEKIPMIIYTHLHFDHAWNTEQFPNAVLIAQRDEMNESIYPMKVQYTSYGFMKQSNGPTWLRSIMRFRAIEGDQQILPGVRVIKTPGHSAGSQSVLVDTAEGTYLIPGDWINNRRSLELECPSGSCPDVYAWQRSYEKIKKLQLVDILPCHDPYTYTREYWG